MRGTFFLSSLSSTAAQHLSLELLLDPSMPLSQLALLGHLALIIFPVCNP